MGEPMDGTTQAVWVEGIDGDMLLRKMGCGWKERGQLYTLCTWTKDNAGVSPSLIRSKAP